MTCLQYNNSLLIWCGMFLWNINPSISCIPTTKSNTMLTAALHWVNIKLGTVLYIHIAFGLVGCGSIFFSPCFLSFYLEYSTLQLQGHSQYLTKEQIFFHNLHRDIFIGTCCSIDAIPSSLGGSVCASEIFSHTASTARLIFLYLNICVCLSVC